MFYKNVSTSVKTFYGVTFKPGETKEVDKYINSKFMILADESPSVTANDQQKPSPDKSKKEPPKKEELKKEEAPKVEPKPEEKPSNNESAKS